MEAAGQGRNLDSDAGPSNQHGQSDMGPSLDDAPDLWLAQLVSLLSHKDKLAVLKANRRLRSAILSHTTNTHLTLLLPADTPARQQGHSLALACSTAAKVTLTLVAHRSSNKSSAAEFVVNYALAQSGFRSLSNITSITLQGMRLVSLSPPWIVSACPHLEILQLNGCLVIPPASQNLHQSFPQLRVLRLPGTVVIPPEIHTVRKQLQSMPGLTHLGTSHASWLQSEVLSGLSNSLTKLELFACGAPSDSAMRNQLIWALPELPALQEFITHDGLTDRIMIALLLKTAVTKVVSLKPLKLTNDEASALAFKLRIHWTASRPLTLQVSRITTRTLCQLPAGRQLVLEGRSAQLVEMRRAEPWLELLLQDTPPPPEVCDDLKQHNLQYPKTLYVNSSKEARSHEVLSWLNNTPDLHIECSVLSIPLSMSAAAIAGFISRLTPSCTHIVLRKLRNDLTPEAVTVIANAISQIPNSIQLSLQGYYEASTLRKLLPALPANVHTLHIKRPRQRDEGTEQDIQRMCSNAVRPVVVVLEGWKLAPGWQRRVTIATELVTPKEHVKTLSELWSRMITGDRTPNVRGEDSSDYEKLMGAASDLGIDGENEIAAHHQHHGLISDDENDGGGQ